MCVWEGVLYFCNLNNLRLFVSALEKSTPYDEPSPLVTVRLVKYKPVIFVQYLYFPAPFTLLTFWLLCCRILYDKRFSAFHYPVTDEDAPNYRSIIQNPMDIATMLQHVDSGQYITCSAFLQDIDLIVTNAKVCMVCSCI